VHVIGLQNVLHKYEPFLLNTPISLPYGPWVGIPLYVLFLNGAWAHVIRLQNVLHKYKPFLLNTPISLPYGH
jgi:hypothetical protein